MGLWNGSLFNLSVLNFLSFLVHNPESFGWPVLRAVSGHAADLAACLLIVCGSIWIGKKTLKQTDGFYAFAAGEAIVALLIMGLGAAGLYSKTVFFSLFIFLAVLGLCEVRSFVFSRHSIKDKLSGLEWFCAGIILLVLAWAALSSGCPAADWDSLAYHLAFPKIFLAAGRLVPLDWSFNIHYPLNPEMISTLLFFLRGAQSVQWMNFLHGIFLLFAVFDFVSRHFNRRAAWLACALIAAQPIFLRVNGNASTDFAVTLASFLALRAFIEGESAFLSGCLAGVAASSKLTGLWTVASIGLLYVRRPKDFGKFILGASLFGFPWYLRNWIWMGNPFWPYFGKLFGAAPKEILLAHRSHLSVTEGIPKTMFNWITSPLQISLRPSSYGQSVYYIVPAFLALFSLRLSRIQENPLSPLTKKILIFVVFYATAWFWVYQMWRYFLPAMVWIAILSAAWAWEISSQNKKSACMSALLILAALSPVLALRLGGQLYAFFSIPSKAFPDLTPQERYLESVLGPAYAAVRSANRVLPGASKVLLYKEVRGFYLDRQYAWGDPLNPGAIDFDQARSAKDIQSSLRSQGFTHVLYNPYIGGYQGDPEYYSRSERLMGEFLAGHTDPLIDEKGVVLRTIK